MCECVTIKGVEYNLVPKEADQFKIVVLERGFVFIGNVTETEDAIRIDGARCLIYWGTSKHLGEIASGGPTKDTKLGAVCVVEAFKSQVICQIPADTSKWKQ